MYAVTVTFELIPGGAEAFMPLMLENARTSLADEPGCLRFDVCTDPARPDEVFLYEVYYDRSMFDRHLTLPHFERFDSAVADLVRHKTIRTFAQVQT
ncbi:putative quinol monooxygenase [Tropicimonas sp. S265A]|uniref:putative quinol monooxygenase n=1 Tax=Tropicimonas sp. S265A TaxID=3415134 RepID=UPI003C7EBCD1